MLEVADENHMRTARVKSLSERRVVLFAAVFVIVANLLVDLAYAALDPRVRYT